MRLRASDKKSFVVSGISSTCLIVTALVACGVDSVDVPTPPVDSGSGDSGSGDSGPAKVDGGVDASNKDAGADADAAVPAYSIGGTVTGLADGTGDAGLEDAGQGGLVLQNGTEKITVSKSGSFVFATKLPPSGAFDVTVADQPTNPVHTCTVNGGKGTVVAGNVTSITVNCSLQTFTVGGHVAGLAGTGLQLRINDSENVDINVNDGTYAFPTALASGTSFAVVVNADPTNRWQHCTVSNGSGIVDDANVANVDIACSNNPYTVSGTISGLTISGLALTNTYSGGGGPETLNPSANATSFLFTQSVLSGEDYAVTMTAPAGLHCTLTGAAGKIAGANVSNVAVVCGPAAFDLAFTGAEQTFKVPAWATAIDVTLEGAQGGSDFAANTNYGGKVEATLAVTGGEELSLFVGGQPTNESGGYNGGGAGDNTGRGGGGATDLRRGGNTLAHRVLVAGGGGGGGTWSNLEVIGGKGGGLVGEGGSRNGTDQGGQGGTQSGSGTGTCVSFDNAAMTGGLGYGGTTVGKGCGCEGYGGGGGYYGGAASGNCRGGGGGSGYAAAVPEITSVVQTLGGAQPGNGRVHLLAK